MPPHVSEEDGRKKYKKASFSRKASKHHIRNAIKNACEEPPRRDLYVSDGLCTEFSKTNKSPFYRKQMDSFTVTLDGRKKIIDHGFYNSDRKP